MERVIHPERARTGRGSLAWVPSLYSVAALAVLGSIFVVALSPQIDTDFWWHMLAGQYIVHHSAVPTRDFFSFTFRGRTWTDHEWGSELMLYGLFRLAGIWGTIAGFAAVICAAYALAYARMRHLGIHPVLGLFVLVPAFVCATPTWGARPQMWTLFFVALYAWLVDRYVSSHDSRYLWAFPVSMVIWTNLHGGFALGLGFLGTMVAGHLLDHQFGGRSELTGLEIRNLAVALVASTLVTAINPNGLREVLYPLQWLYPTAYSNLLNEWLSVDFHQFQSMVFEALVLILLGAACASKNQLRWSRIVPVVAFTHLALSQGRNVAVWSVLITPFVALYVRDAIDSARADSPAPDRRRREVSARRGAQMNLALLLCICLALPLEAFHFITPAALARAESSTFPKAASVYLARHSLPRNVFAPYIWGGYAVWKTDRRYNDFIDGRANTLFDSTILNDYLLATNAQPAWPRVFAKYNVGTALVGTNSPLAEALLHSPGWTLSYRDSQAEIFRRVLR